MDGWIARIGQPNLRSGRPGHRHNQCTNTPACCLHPLVPRLLSLSRPPGANIHQPITCDSRVGPKAQSRQSSSSRSSSDDRDGELCGLALNQQLNCLLNGLFGRNRPESRSDLSQYCSLITERITKISFRICRERARSRSGHHIWLWSRLQHVRAQ